MTVKLIKTVQKLIAQGFDFARLLRKKNISAFAASTAFFLFLSLIPMLMLLCALIPYTPLTESALMKAVTDIAPDSVDPLLVGIIVDVYDKSIGLVSVTAIVTFWSAGKGVMALMQGLNAVHQAEEKRNYFVLRLVASFYTIVMLLAMLFSLLLFVFGSVWFEGIIGQIPQTYYLLDTLLKFRLLFFMIMMIVALALIYTHVPAISLQFKAQLPGAVMAAVGWSLVTFGFSVYIRHFNGFGTYGSLTTVIILMLWLYACMYLVMTGAFLNRYLRRRY